MAGELWPEEGWRWRTISQMGRNRAEVGLDERKRDLGQNRRVAKRRGPLRASVPRCRVPRESSRLSDVYSYSRTFAVVCRAFPGTLLGGDFT